MWAASTYQYVIYQGSIPDGWWTKYDSFVRESDDDVFTALAKKYGNADDMIDDLRGAGNRFTDQTGISGRHAVDIASQANLDKRYYDNIRDKFAQIGEFDVPSEVLDDIASRIKPYDGKITDLYHGTSDDVADAILRDGYMPGSLLPEGVYRGGGYGQMQASTSFATDPKAASVFATAQNPQGTILQAKLNPRANIVTMDGIDYAEDLNDYIQDLRKRGIDGVWIGGDESELVSLNPDMIQNTGKRASVRGVDLKNTDFSQLFR